MFNRLYIDPLYQQRVAMETEEVTFEQFLNCVAADITDISSTIKDGNLALAHFQLGHLAGVLKCKAAELADEECDEPEHCIMSKIKDLDAACEKYYSIIQDLDECKKTLRK